MKNVVSFETAKNLKSAGFPQPKVQQGQIWYAQNSVVQFVIDCDSQRFSRATAHSQQVDVFGVNRTVENNWFFAATATDIMEQLESDFTLSLATRTLWICRPKDLSLNMSTIHENPAECCAAMLLETRK